MFQQYSRYGLLKVDTLRTEFYANFMLMMSQFLLKIIIYGMYGETLNF